MLCTQGHRLLPLGDIALSIVVQGRDATRSILPRSLAARMESEKNGKVSPSLDSSPGSCCPMSVLHCGGICKCTQLQWVLHAGAARCAVALTSSFLECWRHQPPSLGCLWGALGFPALHHGHVQPASS